MPIKIAVEGLDEVILDLSDQAQQLNKMIWGATFREIRDLTPIRTGRARRGWQAVPNPVGVRGDRQIINTVPYVQYLEKGHSKQAPNGFIRQGINRGIDIGERTFLQYQISKLRKSK